MMIFERILANQIKNAIAGERAAVIIYGPRQAGKTTLIKTLFDEKDGNSAYFIGDDLFVQELFGKNNLEALKRATGNAKILVIDEAQRIENIGLSLKLMIDNLPLRILVSGSASFDLAKKINEPLTGRAKTFWLYPLSWREVSNKYRQTLRAVIMDDVLRFGMYPKIHTLVGEQEKQDYLYEYASNYLYKDILIFENIRKPKKVADLLALLALQIGQEVSVAELAQNLNLSQPAVTGYLDVLEKMFVIFNLRGFSRNLRKEISKTSKYYFFDVGLRNALIRNFNKLNLRQDVGALFENWFISEKLKLANNSRRPANFYFWRTYDQKEIDLIEERDGKLIGYECKLSSEKSVSAPKDWIRAYVGAGFEVVNQENCFDYLEL